MVEYTAQSIVLATIPKVPALLSIIGSAYIVHNVLTLREKRKNMYNRIMLGMSVCDILASHSYFLGTWIIPKGSGGPFGPVFWAFGNDATCSYGGFFNQFAVASPIYNSCLSVYYLLNIKFNWSNSELERIEPILHGFPLTFALATSIYALVKDMYGNVFWTCWINPDPPQPKFRYFQWSFLFAPVWICVIVNSIIMCMLWMKMRSLEQRIAGKYQLEDTANNDDDDDLDEKPQKRGMRRFSRASHGSGDDNDDDDDSKEFRSSVSSGSGGGRAKRRSTVINMVKRENRQSSKIAVQGMLYVGAFYVTWFFPTVSRITDLTGTGHFAVQAFDTGLLPLQGMLNVLIYLRPKYLHFKQKHPNLSVWQVFKIVNDPRMETSVVVESQQSRVSRSSNSSRYSYGGAGSQEFLRAAAAAAAASSCASAVEELNNPSNPPRQESLVGLTLEERRAARLSRITTTESTNETTPAAEKEPTIPTVHEQPSQEINTNTNRDSNNSNNNGSNIELPQDEEHNNNNNINNNNDTTNDDEMPVLDTPTGNDDEEEEQQQKSKDEKPTNFGQSPITPVRIDLAGRIS